MPDAQQPHPLAGAQPAPRAPAAAGRPEGGEGYQLPDIVLLVREDGGIRFANRPLGGVPAEEVIGTSLFDYVLPEQHDAVRHCLKSVFAWSQTEECDLKGLRPQALDAWFQCRFAPNVRGGQVATATVIARDVTARKQLEETLRRERDELARRVEELVVELAAARVERKSAVRRTERVSDHLAQLGAIVDEAGEAMFVTDLASGQLVDANETACRWLQTAREELVGRRPEELGLEFPLRVPTDGAPAFTDTRNTNRPVVFDNVRHRRRDRTSFPVEVSLTRHVLGEREYVLAVVRDVKGREQSHHALRETERAYRALFECAGDAVFLTARDGAIAQANRAALELFGYERDAFLKLNARDLYTDARDIARFRDAIRDHAAVTDLDVTFRARDGRIVSARLWATPRRGLEGGIRGYQCVVRVAGAAARAPEETGEAGEAGETVVVVDPDARRREETVTALRRAGYGVVEAGSLEDAVDLLADGAFEVSLVLLDGAARAAAGPAGLAALRERAATAPIVLLADTSRAEELPADLSGVTRAATRPLHPLALLQLIRETLTSGR